MTIVLSLSVLRRDNGYFPHSWIKQQQLLNQPFSRFKTDDESTIFTRRVGKNSIFRTWYEGYFLFAVYQKLAEFVSFCVRKVDFPGLVRENVIFVLIFRTLKIKKKIKKSTFRTQNDTDKANFRCIADKNIFSYNRKAQFQMCSYNRKKWL